MAKVRVKTVTTYTYRMDLSEDEALVLRAVLGRIRGGGEGRPLTTGIFHALGRAGVHVTPGRFPFEGRFED